MTPEQIAEIQAAARDAYYRTRADQGLPAHCTDPAVLERVAALLRPPATLDEQQAA